MSSPACCEGGGVSAEDCQPGGKIGELGGEDRGELGGELRGEDRSESSSGDMMSVGEVVNE